MLESFSLAGGLPIVRTHLSSSRLAHANGPLHLGHLAGAYLPADIFARYHRAKGNEVIMVSGSDQGETPDPVSMASAEGVERQRSRLGYGTPSAYRIWL